MFYSDSTMDKIYIDEGSFVFSYQLPIMIYSLLISSVLKSLLNILGLYEKNIIEIKKQEMKSENIMEKIFKIKLKNFIIFYYNLYIIIFILDLFRMLLRCI